MIFGCDHESMAGSGVKLLNGFIYIFIWTEDLPLTKSGVWQL